MTILNYAIAERWVCLVMDTVVSDPEDMGPIGFTTKMHPVPHLRGVICGTGIMQFVTEWSLVAMTSMLVRDVKQLGEHTQQQLILLFAKYAKEAPHVTSTIYHFGFVESEQRFVGYAFRSTTGFTPERLPDECTAFKPSNIDPEDFDLKMLPADFLQVAEQQKAADDAALPSGRVGIGGHLVSCVLTLNANGEVQTTLERFHEFADAAKAYHRACLKLPANAA